MDEWTSQVVVNNIHFTIVANKIYSPSLDEFVFEVEISKESKVIYTSTTNIYSKREVEVWAREILKCEILKFNWLESE
ncbi:hypothetical protein [Paenibacillus hexagrammi]|uniref:Uncharacterized protein n=1 Tax=Paenibacillus hexagrammi TaxID=2908839 RepID=A0ABY3SPY0_9BACL|nr:hypothetical protein [Paenibacillus sp. YPD9-1]UJF35185.1 hypothetical protein L0M14_08700 [Paenibacillus sp. YPD9-1]